MLHGQRYLDGQRLQAEHWLGARAGELVWCTAASGWSKSARNVFIAPWITGASALLHDARFDPAERLELLARERVNVLCMAPTEYRVIAARAQLRPLPDLRAMVAAGEALNPEVLHAWREATGLEIRDGYGQTETGQMTGMPLGEPARPGSMGRALPGVRAVGPRRRAGRRPGERADLLPRLSRRGRRATRRRDVAHRGPAARAAGEPWHTGDRVGEDDEGYLWFEGRSDDVIVSAGYRIGPFEVESALVAHPAVAEAAAVAAPDPERGAVVRAVVVLRDGYCPLPRARQGAAGARQARDRALQVPADRRLRARAAEDRERQGQACRAPGAVSSARLLALAPRVAVQRASHLAHHTRLRVTHPHRGSQVGTASCAAHAGCPTGSSAPTSSELMRSSSTSTSCATVLAGGRRIRNAARIPSPTQLAATM